MSIRNTNIRRPGISLVEMLAVMSVLSVTIGVVAMSLGVMQRTSDRILDGLDNVNQRDRLATQLRIDAHEASAVEWDNGEQRAESDPLLSLRMDADITVQYRLYSDGIERVALAGTTIQHRDTFFVRPDMAAGWAVDTDRPYPLVSLQLRPYSFGQLGDDAKLPPLRLDAAVGIGRVGGTAVAARRADPSQLVWLVKEMVGYRTCPHTCSFCPAQPAANLPPCGGRLAAGWAGQKEQGEPLSSPPSPSPTRQAGWGRSLTAEVVRQR